MSAAEITRKEAVELCVALGFKTASRWNKERMLKKLKDLSEMVEDGSIKVGDDNDDADRLNDFLQRIADAGGEVTINNPITKKETVVPEEETVVPEEETVVAEESKPKPKPKSKTKKVAKPKIEKETNDDDDVVDDDETVVVVEATQRRRQSRPGPNLGDLKGVKSLHNRLFCAGVVLRKHGMDEGVTKKMIEEVDDSYERNDMVASRSQLVSAWHVLNGFNNG